MNRILFFFFCLWCPTFIFGQTISRGEYYINSDGGIGTAISFEVENNVVNGVINLNINPTSAQPGINTLGIRVQNNYGSWSHTSTSLFYMCPALAIQNVLTAEYFIDNDPGFDNGVAINVSPSTNILVVENLDLSELSDGMHTICIRSKSNTGEWSQTHSSILFVSKDLSQSQLSRFEYFIDSDPGFGQGMQASNSQISGTQQLVLSDINVSSLPSGMHVIGVRGMNQNGTWSHTERKLFYKSNGLELKSLVAYEYFIDTDPGFGGGIAFTPPSNNGEMTEVSQNINISNLSSGTHTIFWRTKDEDGKWSLTGSRTFQICDIAYSLVVNDASCYNSSNGQIAITIDAMENATYNWLPSGLNGSGTSTVTGLTAGNYNCSITTTSGCNFSQEITVSQPDPITNYFTVEECSEYNFLGQILTSSGTYSATTTNENGCDELNVLTLSITQDFYIYYADNDGDGYGAGVPVQFCIPPGEGYSALGSDCNDNNAGVYPGAIEVCNNLIDDDCDGIINEGCLTGGPANDEFVLASTVAGASFPFCANRTTNLTNATASPQATTTAPVGAGQDVWYSFVAATNGARITSTSTTCDIVIELQDASNTALFVENETTSGQEILVANNLAPGVTYYVLVRNFNPSSVGTVATCIQNLVTSAPDNGTTFNNLCSFIKCDWNGAQLYSVTFDDGVNQYSASNTSTQIPFSLLPGLQYGMTYDVTFTTTFIQNDAAGNPTSVVVASAPFTVTIEDHLAVALRSADRCPTTRTLGAFIGTDRVLCGVTGYEWEFTLANEFGSPIALEPVLVNTTGVSRYVRVSSIGGVQGGDYYNVRIRPVFSYGPGTFGSVQMLCVAGSAGMVDNNPVMDMSTPNTGDALAVVVYPNPTAGEFVNVRVSNITSDIIQVRITDALGRCVIFKNYTHNGVLNVALQLETMINSGIYSLQIVDGERTCIKRILVL